MMMAGSFTRCAVALAVAVSLLGASPAPVTSAALAASPSPAPGMVMNGYQIETDLVNGNLKSGDFTMPREVRVTRTGSDARGDRAHGNSNKGIATLEGHVVVHDNGGAPEAKDAGADYQGPSTITCDTLTLDSKNRSYDAQGNVRFVQGNRIGTAQRGILNQTAHTLHLEGNVILSEGETSIRGSVVDYNLQTRDVVASGAPIIIRQPVPGPTPGPPQSPKPATRKRR